MRRGRARGPRAAQRAAKRRQNVAGGLSRRERRVPLGFSPEGGRRGDGQSRPHLSHRSHASHGSHAPAPPGALPRPRAWHTGAGSGAGSGGALGGPGRVGPMRLWAGGFSWDSLPGRPADRKGAGMAAMARGVAGGFAVPCAPLRRVVGAMARPGAGSGPQEPPAARRQGRSCGSSRSGISMMPGGEDREANAGHRQAGRRGGGRSREAAAEHSRRRKPPDPGDHPSPSPDGAEEGNAMPRA